MPYQRKHGLILTIIVVLFVLSYMVKFLGPVWLERAYQNNSFSILNTITQSTENHPLEFYLGRAEVNLFGPLSLLFSGAAFLIFVLTFLKDVSHKVFGFFVFCFLVLTKFEIMLWPPYGDSASGPFMEAIWLFEHGFNYSGLIQQEPFIHGGPKVYIFSVYPTYIALLMKAISHIQWNLFVNHMLVFVYGAVVVTYFRKIMELCVSRPIATLLSVLFLSYPLFQSQVEQLNMEMPVTFFTVLAMYHLCVKRLPIAAIMAIAAVMVKGVAIYVCAAVFVVGVWLFFMDDKLRFKFSTVFFATLPVIFLALKTYGALFILNKGGSVAMIGMLAGWFWMKMTPVFYMYVVSVLFFIAYYFTSHRTDKAFSIKEYIQKHFVYFVCFISAGGWFGLYIHSFGDQVRYRLMLAPFLLACVFYVVSRFLTSDKLQKNALIVLTLFSFWSGYGLLYPRLYSNGDAKHERSLEYRNDIRLDMRIARLAEEKFSAMTVSAPFTVAHLLAYPELGYIHQQIDVMLYGYPSGLDRVREFKGLKDVNIAKTVWIALDQTPIEFLKDKIDYPIGPQDKVLNKIVYGDRQATFFLGGIEIEKLRRVNLLLLKKLQEKGKLLEMDQFKADRYK
ncbi:MAG: hypothetical protein KC618_02320 [Candidatus Omnitrophica bacterium]|nr:hypothetical protein [Candidatus Omnitrophota bacterium]